MTISCALKDYDVSEPIKFLRGKGSRSLSEIPVNCCVSPRRSWTAGISMRSTLPRYAVTILPGPDEADVSSYSYHSAGTESGLLIRIAFGIICERRCRPGEKTMAAALFLLSDNVYRTYHTSIQFSNLTSSPPMSSTSSSWWVERIKSRPSCFSLIYEMTLRFNSSSMPVKGSSMRRIWEGIRRGTGDSHTTFMPPLKVDTGRFRHSSGKQAGQFPI